MTTATLAPARRTTRRPCAVCQLPADVLLCHECLSDIPLAHDRIRAWLNINKAQAIAALDRWDAIRAPQQAAWKKIQDSQANDPPYTHISKCAEHVKKGNVYGVLLDAQAAYEAALAPLAAERERLEKALSILEGM